MEFVKTTTEDGLKFQGLLAEPENKTDTVILHVHGMSGNFWENSFIKTMLKRYPDNGIAFLSGENRGAELIRWFHKTNGSIERIGDSYEIFEDCVKDIDAWVKFLEEKGYKNIHLQGHSLGCPKITYYHKIKSTPLIKSLLLISPADMMGLLVNDKDKIEYEKFLKEAKDLMDQGKPDQLLSGIQWEFAMMSAKSFLNFSWDNDNLAIFNFYNPDRGFEAISNVDVPMLAFTGTKDDAILGDKIKSMEMLKENATKCPKFDYAVFDSAEHSFDGFEDQIVDKVIEFLK